MLFWLPRKRGYAKGVSEMAQRELSGAAAEVSRNIEGASQNGVGAGGHACRRSTTAQLSGSVGCKERQGRQTDIRMRRAPFGKFAAD